MLAIGGKGVVSVVANIVPKDSAKMVKAWHDGKVEQARKLFYKLLPLCQAMFYETNPIPVKTSLALMGKIGEEFSGFINSLANFGFFVELDAYFVEGLVKLSFLADDDYDYYEREYLIKGRRHGRKFRLGDNVRVKVARINAFRSEIDFELVDSGNNLNIV